MNSATVLVAAWIFSTVLLSGLPSTQANAHVALVKMKPAYQWVAADGVKRCFVDLTNLKFIDESDGRQIADAWIKCEVDDVYRKRIIDARIGQEETVDGFERLAYVKRHVWFKLADPAYRNPAALPLRMIAQEVYYDTYGAAIYSTVPLTSWQGGKWFTIPGFEEIVQKILAAKAGKH